MYSRHLIFFRLFIFFISVCTYLPSQVLVVAFSVLRMKRSVSRLNVLGLLFVLVGAVRYTVISRREKKQQEGEQKNRGTITSSAGSGIRAARRHHRHGNNNGGSSVAAAVVSSGTSVLPTTVKLPAVNTAAGVTAVMVNGKRVGKRREEEEEYSTGDGAKGEGERRTAMVCGGGGWWGGEDGDVSRRNR